jgi:hypothetical protein
MGFWLVFIIVTVLVLAIGPFALAFIPAVGPILAQVLRTARSAIVNVLKPVVKYALKILWASIKMIPHVFIALSYKIAGALSKIPPFRKSESAAGGG